MNGQKARTLRKLSQALTVGKPKEQTRKYYQSLKKESNDFLKSLGLRLALQKN